MLLLLGCADALDSSVDTALSAFRTPAEVTTSSVRYVLAWDTTGVEIGDGWTVTTDSGWRVQVSAAALTSYGASMVQCADIVAWRPRLIAQAWAGHGDMNDASTVEQPVIEDFLVPADTELGSAGFDEAAYCRTFWLSASATLTTTGLDTHPWMLDHTLVIDAVATSPAGETRSLALRSVKPTGVLVDFDTPGEGALRVDIVRHLATSFDGIDLASASEDDIAWAVLSNLSGDTTLRLSFLDGA